MARPAAALRRSAASARRILIVDDSAVARAVMTRAITERGGLEVVGAVSSAEAAFGFLAQAAAPVESIVLDLNLPGIGGLSALPDLIAASEGARVLLVSSSCREGAAATIEGLARGAADTLEKPATGDLTGRFAKLLCDKLEGFAEVSTGEASDTPPPRPSAAATAIVAIGASTGGINALGKLLRELPASFRVPILITQHLPASFMPFFATQVAVLGSRPCDLAVDHLRVRPGRIIVAPGDAHMRVVTTGGGAAIRLSTSAARSGCLPSVDPMFESVAELFGDRAVGVVLSGMGRDGCDGARLLAAAGAQVYAQDEATSVVWGMPGAVAAAGLARWILPPDEIGRALAEERR